MEIDGRLQDAVDVDPVFALSGAEWRDPRHVRAVEVQRCRGPGRLRETARAPAWTGGHSRPARQFRVRRLVLLERALSDGSRCRATLVAGRIRESGCDL